MIMLHWWLDRIYATKKIAIKLNVIVWFAMVAYAMITLFTVSAIFDFIIISAIESFPEYGLPYYAHWIKDNFTIFSLVSMGIIGFVMFDKFIIMHIHITHYVNKITFAMINKADIYLWRKTGKDSPISSLLLKGSIMFMKLPKPLRTGIAIFFFVGIPMIMYLT